MQINRGIKKTEVFQKTEQIVGKGFEQIPLFLDAELGTNLKCPKCNNKQYFQVFFDSEVISVNTIIDHYSKIWRIETPTLGALKIKNIKCLNCGNKNSDKEFIKNE